MDERTEAGFAEEDDSCAHCPFKMGKEHVSWRYSTL